MVIEILRGKGHGKTVICINDRRVAGMKDGYGYTIVETFKVDDDEVQELLDKET